jgi:hypothetical protein
MPALEARSEGVWVAAQTGRATGGATAVKRIKKVGGGINVNRDDGSENYSDGGRFSDAVDFVNSIVGQGNPVAQGQADIAGYLAWLILGQESSVTGSADPFTHVATPAAGGGLWSHWWKKVGIAVGPLRQEFSDCRLTSLRIEGSSANKVVKLTPTFISLVAGKVFTTDPVAVSAVDAGMLYTEGVGRFNIDGTVYQGHSSFAIVINDATDPWYGDDVYPQDVTFGVASVDIEGVTLLVDANGLARYNQQIYGAAAPAVGALPLKTVPLMGSYTIDLQRGRNFSVIATGASAGTFTITVPGFGTTAPIPFNATAAQVAAAVALITGLAGKVTATGGPLPGTAVAVVISPDVPTGAITANSGALTGGTAVITDNSAQRQLKIDVPGVKWSPDLAIEGNPDGGPTEIALAGQARINGVNPFVRVTTKSADAAYVAS